MMAEMLTNPLDPQKALQGQNEVNAAGKVVAGAHAIEEWGQQRMGWRGCAVEAWPCDAAGLWLNPRVG